METTKCTKCSSDVDISVDCKRGHNICRSCMLIDCPLCQYKLLNPVDLEKIIGELDAMVLQLIELRKRASRSKYQKKTDFEDKIPEEQVKEADIHVESIKEQKETATKYDRCTEQKKADKDEKETDPKNEKPEEEKETDIKDLEYACEGAQFCKWRCKWKGNNDHVLKHFQHSHQKNVLVQKRPFLNTKIDLNRSSSTLNLIRLEINGKERLFWYKQKIDLEKKVVYFIIQYLGPKEEANKYFYEFTASNNLLDVLKIRQMCESSNENIDIIIDGGRCGIIPFNIIKNYVDDMEIAFVFKIESIELEIEKATCSMSRRRPPSDAKGMKPIHEIKKPIKEIYFCEPEFNRDVVNFIAVINMGYNIMESYFSEHTFYHGLNETEKRFIFNCRNDVKRRNTCFLIKYFGEESIANNYVYEIIIINDPLKSFKMQKKCRSSHEKESKIINEDGYITFPFNITRSCLNDYGEISFAVVIKESNCSEDHFDVDRNPPSYVYIMKDYLESKIKTVKLPYIFAVAVNQYNFPIGRLQTDPVAASNVATIHPKLFTPIYYNFLKIDGDGGDGVHVIMFTKVTINFERNSSHTRPLLVACGFNLRSFCVKTYRDIKSRMMHWIVVYEGAKEKAAKFFYELSVFCNPLNFFKVKMVCNSNCESDQKYIKAGKCVSLPFDSMKNFMNRNNQMFCVITIRNKTELITSGTFYPV